jgi:hypothetical protein
VSAEGCARSFASLWHLCRIFGLPLLFGCRSPTEITVALSTDVPCAEFLGDDLYAGNPIVVDADGTALAAQTGCPASSAPSPDGGTISLGTFVLAPSGDRNAEVSVVVVGATEALAGAALYTPDKCTALLSTSGSIAGTPCIVARRALGFVEHTPLTLPIELARDCEGIPCTDGTTCVAGACVSDMVDPGKCTDHTCGPGSLSGDAPSDASSFSEAGPDATADATLHDASHDATNEAASEPDTGVDGQAPRLPVCPASLAMACGPLPDAGIPFQNLDPLACPPPAGPLSFDGGTITPGTYYLTKCLQTNSGLQPPETLSISVLSFTLFGANGDAGCAALLYTAQYTVSGTPGTVLLTNLCGPSFDGETFNLAYSVNLPLFVLEQPMPVYQYFDTFQRVGPPLGP